MLVRLALGPQEDGAVVIAEGVVLADVVSEVDAVEQVVAEGVVALAALDGPHEGLVELERRDRHRVDELDLFERVNGSLVFDVLGPCDVDRVLEHLAHALATDGEAELVGQED